MGALLTNHSVNHMIYDCTFKCYSKWMQKTFFLLNTVKLNTTQV